METGFNRVKIIPSRKQPFRTVFGKKMDVNRNYLPVQCIERFTVCPVDKQYKPLCSLLSLHKPLQANTVMHLDFSQKAKS